MTKAVLNPSAVNILKALTPVGAIEIYGGKMIKAVKNPTVENIEGAFMLPIGPRPSQVSTDLKALWKSISTGTDFWSTSLDIISREIIPGFGRIFLYEIVEGMLSDYQRQAEGKWEAIPEVLIQIIQPYYKMNLSLVKFGVNIVTSNPHTAIAFPGQIFFPRNLAPLADKNDLRWLLHELTHQDQYLRVGGLRNFLDNYATDIARKVISTKSFDVHDVLEYEKEADHHADSILEGVWERLQANSFSFRP